MSLYSCGGIADNAVNKMRLRLGCCLYAIIGGVLRSLPVEGFSSKFIHAFNVLIKLLNCWMKIMNIGNVICVSFTYICIYIYIVN